MREFVAFCMNTGEVRMTRADSFESAVLSVERAWKVAPRSEKFFRDDESPEVVVKQVPRHMSVRDNEDVQKAAIRETRNDKGVGFRRIQMRYAFDVEGKVVSEVELR